MRKSGPCLITYQKPVYLKANFLGVSCLLFCLVVTGYCSPIWQAVLLNVIIPEKSFFTFKARYMETSSATTSLGSQFAQVAWVVNDIQATEKFFREVMGVPQFVKMENLRAEDLEGSYYGNPASFSFHLYMAASGETLIELIQPVSGQSIFQDYLDKHPEGGVQHIAYAVPVAELEKTIAELTNKGYPVISDLSLPTAKVAYFDTSKEIGVVTEIVGVTEAGFAFVNDLKRGALTT
jgi:methylmalonyl-CoA/ethylmalonyl-CoA epimerase